MQSKYFSTNSVTDKLSLLRSVNKCEILKVHFLDVLLQNMCNLALTIRSMKKQNKFALFLQANFPDSGMV